MCRQIKNGFTLAEVLVTLAIIGIVAALTIPSLITNIQDQQLKTAWKKSYSAFSQATNQLLEEENGNFINAFATDAIMQSKYAPYFSIVKTYSTWGGWHSNNNWYLLNGTPINSTISTASYLADGTIVAFDISGAAGVTCSDIKGAITDICAEVTFDINGLKGPNTIGKDIFSLYVRSNGIIPRGSYLDQAWVQASCTSTGQGLGCANKYLLE